MRPREPMEETEQPRPGTCDLQERVRWGAEDSVRHSERLCFAAGALLQRGAQPTHAQMWPEAIWTAAAFLVQHQERWGIVELDMSGSANGESVRPQMVKLQCLH